MVCIIDQSGSCTECKKEADDNEILQCQSCEVFCHATCGEGTPSKPQLINFKKIKSRNFIFYCDSCLTRRESFEASSTKEQIDELKQSVSDLHSEFKKFQMKFPDTEKKKPSSEDEQPQKWSEVVKTDKRKATLCIKSGSEAVDLSEIGKLAVENNIQISSAKVSEKGDIFINMPSQVSKEALAPLLNQSGINKENIIEVKSKLPTISVLNVKNYESKERFIEKVKKQNPTIKTQIENGSEFNVVFSKKPKDETSEQANGHQVVIRVSEEIRNSIKRNGNRIFLELSAHKVVDRFYIKRCNRCQMYGHYQNQCTKQMNYAVVSAAPKNIYRLTVRNQKKIVRNTLV